MNEPKTYRIGHITDLMTIPRDRRAACVVGLLPILEKMAFAVQQMNSLTGEPQPPAVYIPYIDWVDDGDENLQVNLIINNEEKHVLYDSTEASTPTPGGDE